MSYAETVILALLVHVIVNFSVIRNSHFQHDTPEAGAYRRFILSIIILYISDVLWGVLYSARLIPAVFLDTAVFFMAMAATVFTWTRYVIRYLNDSRRIASVLSVTGWVFLAFFGTVLIVNVFTPVMYWVGGEGEDHAGNLRDAALAVQVLLFLATAVYTLNAARSAEPAFRNRHIAIGFSAVTMSAMVVLQVFFPLMPLYSAGSLLVSCILHSFVVNDMKEARRLELEEMLRREQEQQRELGSARQMAYTDSLTGAKNTHAYIEKEKKIDDGIAAGELKEFGVIVFDLNGLKYINDTRGHEVGDRLIQDACRMICRKFKHSPVFRIGGDEFVALLEGEDYENRKRLLAEFEDQAEENIRSGGVVVASGLAVFRPGHDNSYRRVFERADGRMYDRKGALKAMED